MLAQLATRLLQLIELWLILESIKKEYAALLRETNTRSNQRRACLFCFLLRLHFFVKLDGLRRRRALQASLLVFRGSVPVDHVPGNFFPLATFGAVVADAVSVDLIF